MKGSYVDKLFERALDAVIGMDVHGNVIAWNQSATDIFGWTADEAIGRQLSTLIIPRRLRRQHSEGLLRYLATGNGPVLNRRINVVAIDRSGEEFPVELAVIDIGSEGETLFYGFLRSLKEQEESRRKLARRAVEAEVLLGLSERIMSRATSDDILRYAIRKVCESTGWPVGHLYVCDDPAEPRTLIPTDIWHMSNQRYEEAVQVSAQTDFAKGQGLPGAVWERDDAVVIEDITKDARFLRAKAFGKIGLVGAFALPIRESGRLIAVMEFFSDGPSREAEELVNFARTISGHVSVALERKSASERREMLSRELSHRVGNSLSILASIFRRCCRTSDSVEELRASFEPRLLALGRAHHVLTEAPTGRVTLRELAQQSLALVPAGRGLEISGEEIELGWSAASPLALVLHELASNALKHGAGSSDDGMISVEWHCEPPSVFRFVWRERFAHKAGNLERRGYGSTLIEAMVTTSLGGTYRSSATEEGYIFEAELPLRHFETVTTPREATSAGGEPSAVSTS